MFFLDGTLKQTVDTQYHALQQPIPGTLSHILVEKVIIFCCGAYFAIVEFGAHLIDIFLKLPNILICGSANGHVKNIFIHVCRNSISSSALLLSSKTL